MSQSKPQSLELEGRCRFRFRFGRCQYRMRSLSQPVESGLRRQELVYLPCLGLASPKFRCNFGRTLGTCHRLDPSRNQFHNRVLECYRYQRLVFGKVMSQAVCSHSARRRSCLCSNKHQGFRRCRHLGHTCQEFRRYHRRYLNCLATYRCHCLGQGSLEFHRHQGRRQRL